MNHTCPICGYEKLRRPAENDLICPCCGVHFGLDDYLRSHEELRGSWIEQGAQWFSDFTRKPQYWSALVQLTRAGHVLTESQVHALLAREDGQVAFAHLVKCVVIFGAAVSEPRFPIDFTQSPGFTMYRAPVNQEVRIEQTYA